MSEPVQAEAPNERIIEPFGQQPGLFKLYTQICLCYPVNDTNSRDSIIKILQKGLERLSDAFPWVAGQVVNKGATVGNTGTFYITSFGRSPVFIMKKLDEDAKVPSMSDLRRAEFPFGMLDEGVIAPCDTLAAGSDGPALIFLVQANFVTGGLLLTFNAQHNVMDMTGQYEIMRLLSKACNGLPFEESELAFSNIGRRDIVPLLGETWDAGSDFAHQIISSSPAEEESGNLEEPAAPKCTWAYFTFSPTSLIALKDIAMKTKPTSVSYITTDDALTALIWQCVTQARLPRLDSTATITLARAVDPRRYLGIPETYPGLVQNMTYHTFSPFQLLEEPIGVIAAGLRAAVDPKTSDIGHATRALATILHRSSDKGSVSVTAGLDLSTDIMLSSWAKTKCYDLDFGLGLGKPEAVRRPRFAPVESLVYAMPKRGDGELVVGMCLRDGDMERLRGDEVFGAYAKFVG